MTTLKEPKSLQEKKKGVINIHVYHNEYLQVIQFKEDIEFPVLRKKLLKSFRASKLSDLYYQIGDDTTTKKLLANQKDLDEFIEMVPMFKDARFIVDCQVEKITDWKIFKKTGENMYLGAAAVTETLLNILEIPYDQKVFDTYEKIIKNIHVNLTHSNILRVYDIVKKDKKMFLLSEHVPDSVGSLYSQYKEGFDELLIRQYGFQILLGLNHIHKTTFHGSISVDSILINEWGKIRIDLWPSYVVQKDKTKSHYELPEKEPSKAGDIYSFACCMIEMLLQKKPKKPFDSLDLNEITENKSFKELLGKALNKDPTKRPTVGELLKFDCINEGKKIITPRRTSFIRDDPYYLSDSDEEK